MTDLEQSALEAQRYADLRLETHACIEHFGSVSRYMAAMYGREHGKIGLSLLLMRNLPRNPRARRRAQAVVAFGGVNPDGVA